MTDLLVREPEGPKNPKKLFGSTIPRIYTPPLPERGIGEGEPGDCPCGCALTPDTSRGFAVIKWADRVGLRDPQNRLVVLDPWQQWLLIHALELDGSRSSYRFRTVLVLVARQNGKTTVDAVLTLWLMYETDARLLVGTAQELALSREIMNEVLAPMMLNTLKLRERFNPDAETQEERVGIWNKVWSDEFLRLDSFRRNGRAVGPDGGPPNGPRYLIKSLNDKAGRGLAGVAKVGIDELLKQYNFDGWSSISNTVLTVPDAQIWCMSNAGDAKSELLRHLRGLALAGTEPSLFHAEWSAPDGCDQEDPEALAQANPSLGYRLTMDALIAAVRANPRSRIENLCQFVDVISTAIDTDAWAAGADPVGAMPEGVRPVVCVEAATDDSQVVALSCAETSGSRYRLEVVGVWASSTDAKVGLAELKTILRPDVIGWFPKGPGNVLSVAMRKMNAVEIKQVSVPEVCSTFADYVDNRQVMHSDDPLLNDHIRHTGTVGTAATWVFDRGPGATHAVWAAAGALHLALSRPEPRRRERRVIVADA